MSRVYLNDGSGVLVDATATSLGVLNDDVTAVEVFDVDGDVAPSLRLFPPSCAEVER